MAHRKGGAENKSAFPLTTVQEKGRKRNDRVEESRLIPYRKSPEADFIVFYRKPPFAPEF
jgi:hypothetical protein